MKMFFSICILFVFFDCLANCPSQLSGTWEGNYTDHGPFGRTIPIKLIFKVQSEHFTGSTLTVSKRDPSLTRLTVNGTCNTSGIFFSLMQDKTDNFPGWSTIRFINPNEIHVTLHWQTAMIGGDGQALLERQR